MEGHRESSAGMWAALIAFAAAIIIWLILSAAGGEKRNAADRDAVLVYKEAGAWKENI